MNSLQCQYKIIVIGESGTGKTSLLHRFTDDKFSENTRITIGVDFAIFNKQIKGELVTGRYWDTAGLERYRSLLQVCYRGADAAIIVYDITSKGSFLEVRNWIRTVRVQSGKVDENEIPIILVGNKTDLVEPKISPSTSSEVELTERKRGISFNYCPREVDYEQGLKIAKDLKCVKFFETSAKNADNVVNAFEFALDYTHMKFCVNRKNDVNSYIHKEIKNIEDDYENAGKSPKCFTGLCKLY